MFDVPHFFTHEVANNRRLDPPQQVRRENKTAIQRYDNIHSAHVVFPRNLFPQCRQSRGDARRGKRRSLSPAQIFSSAITRPARVLSFAANSAAAPMPPAHARSPPLVSTGQPSRSHRLTCFSFNKRFSLSVPRKFEHRFIVVGAQLARPRLDLLHDPPHHTRAECFFVLRELCVLRVLCIKILPSFNLKQVSSADSCPVILILNY